MAAVLSDPDNRLIHALRQFAAGNNSPDRQELLRDIRNWVTGKCGKVVQAAAVHIPQLLELLQG